MRELLTLKLKLIFNSPILIEVSNWDLKRGCKSACSTEITKAAFYQWSKRCQLTFDTVLKVSDFATKFKKSGKLKLICSQSEDPNLENFPGMHAPSLRPTLKFYSGKIREFHRF